MMATDTTSECWETSLGSWLSDAKKRIETTALTPSTEQVGRVERVADGIATVSGLPGAAPVRAR
jgi:F-type H+-transporting ATPase subunit alpha